MAIKISQPQRGGMLIYWDSSLNSRSRKVIRYKLYILQILYFLYLSYLICFYRLLILFSDEQNGREVRALYHLDYRLTWDRGTSEGNMKEYYSTKELSEKLGIKEVTIRKWVFDRKIPHYKIGGGKGILLFKINEIEEWLNRQRVKPHMKIKA